jgi:uncharacterized repeat protein (TIGR01451 family)
MRKIVFFLTTCWLLMMGNAKSQVVYEFGDAPAQIEEMFGPCMTVAGYDEYILDTTCMLSYTDTFTVYDKYTNYLSEYRKWTFLKYLKNVHTLQIINKNKSEAEAIDIYNCLKYCPKNIINLYITSPVDLYWDETLPAHFQSLFIDLERTSGFLQFNYSSKSFFQQNSSLKELYLSFVTAGNTSSLLRNKFSLPDSLESLTFLISDELTNKPPPEEYIENQDFLGPFPSTLKEINIETDFIRFSKDVFAPCIALEKLKYVYTSSLLDELRDEEFNTDALFLPLSLKQVQIEDELSAYNTFPRGYLGNLPPALEKLSVVRINKPELFEEFIFPESLREISWQSGFIDSLPLLPSISEKLDFSDNRLNSISSLPPNLLSLNVNSNRSLKCLPRLPYSLRTLLTNTTNIACIPNETFGVKSTPNRQLCTNPAGICDFDSNAVASLKGRIYLDVNGNLSPDPADFFVPSVLLESQPGAFYGLTNTSGTYTIYADTGASSTIRPISTNFPYVQSYEPASYTVDPSGKAFLGDTFNFRLVAQPNVTDAEVFLTGSRARPGFDASVAVLIKNRGTEPLQSDIKLLIPNTWQLEDAEPDFSERIVDTLIWRNISLGLFKDTTLYVLFTVPSNTPINTSYEYETIAITTLQDTTPLNNIFKLKGTVTGSYDPNDKLVTPEQVSPDYSSDQELIYTIRFQNTGNDTAFNVSILDTIRNPLQLNTFRLIGSSHKCEVLFKADNVVEFYFPNILLPDSLTNEPASNGFVMFAMKPEAGLGAGSDILNNAAIFFDYNEPIITAFALTGIRTSVNTAFSTNAPLIMYPNPTSKTFRFGLSNIARDGNLSIMDVQGKVVLTRYLSSLNEDIDVSALSPGMYIVSLFTDQYQSSGKLMVMD